MLDPPRSIQFSPFSGHSINTNYERKISHYDYAYFYSLLSVVDFLFPVYEYLYSNCSFARARAGTSFSLLRTRKRNRHSLSSKFDDIELDENDEKEIAAMLITGATKIQTQTSDRIMKLASCAFLTLFTSPILGLTVELQPSQHAEEKDHESVPAEIHQTPIWDDVLLDQSFVSLSSFFDDLVKIHSRFFSNLATGARDDEAMIPVPAHPFLRSRSNLLSSIILPHATSSKIIDTNDKFEVSLPLPTGMTIEDVYIEIVDGGSRLLIRGETQSSNPKNDQTLHDPPTSAFFAQNSFSESISLDPAVEVDHFLATFKDGILKVSAPKDDRKLKHVNHQVPIQDLDAVAMETATSNRNRNKLKFLPFTKKSAPSEKHVSEDREGREAKEDVAGKTPMHEAGSIPLANAITDTWKDVQESSL
jgi:HSP20 family molecular chaperone IbpA